MTNTTMKVENDNADNDWHKSVERVVQQSPRARLMREDHMMFVASKAADLTRWRIPVTYGHVPRLCVGLKLAEEINWSGNLHKMFVVLLLERGLGADDSVLAYRNLRVAFPTLTSIEGMHQLMSEKQLTEEFGAFYGPLISSTLQDPSGNPTLHALLFGNFHIPIRPTYATAVAEVEVGHLPPRNMYDLDNQLVLRSLRPYKEGEVVDLNVQPGPFKLEDMGFDRAEKYYLSFTGHGLPLPYNLHPLEKDYEKIAEEVRQANSAKDREGGWSGLGRGSLRLWR